MAVVHYQLYQKCSSESILWPSACWRTRLWSARFGGYAPVSAAWRTTHASVRKVTGNSTKLATTPNSKTNWLHFLKFSRNNLRCQWHTAPSERWTVWIFEVMRVWAAGTTWRSDCGVQFLWCYCFQVTETLMDVSIDNICYMNAIFERNRIAARQNGGGFSCFVTFSSQHCVLNSTTAWSWSANYEERQRILESTCTPYRGRQVGGRSAKYKLKPSVKHEANETGITMQSTEQSFLQDAQQWVTGWPQVCYQLDWTLGSWQFLDQETANVSIDTSD